MDKPSPNGVHYWKWLLATLRVVLPLAIIAWLLSMIDPGEFQSLWDRPKNWGVLGAAFLVTMTAVVLTFVRWCLLVRTLGIEFSFGEAFRLGSLAYLLNFVSVGAVGGDLFKAVFIARAKPGRRTEAVASVVVDRIVGLYGLLLVTTIAILVVETPSSPAITTIRNMTYAVTAAATVGVAIMLIPGFATGPLFEALTQLPFVGSTVERVLSSFRMYRERKTAMAGVLALGMGVHVLLAIGIYLIACGLFPITPTLGEHFLIVPMSNVAGSLPLGPAGLGTFEFAMQELYELVQAGGPGTVTGVLVALGYRLITIGIAAVGMVYYWTSRQQVKEVLREAERELHEQQATAS